jgi:hypothetical protein
MTPMRRRQLSAGARDAGLFTNPAEIANFNADPDLDALRSELLFVGFRQSVWP